MSNARQRRIERAERANLIAQLGWAPEPPVADERYCATTGELRQSVIEKFGRCVADNCAVAAQATR